MPESNHLVILVSDHLEVYVPVHMPTVPRIGEFIVVTKDLHGPPTTYKVVSVTYSILRKFNAADDSAAFCSIVPTEHPTNPTVWRAIEDHRGLARLFQDNADALTEWQV